MTGRAPGAAGSAEPVEWRLVARPRTARWCAILGAVVVVAAMTGVATALRTVNTGVHFRFADQVAMVLLGVLVGAGLLLLARPRVRAGAAGVEVRNLVNTRAFGWAQVEGFGFPDGAIWARLELADDEYTPMLAIQVVDGGRAAAAMRGLRALRTEYLPERAG